MFFILITIFPFIYHFVSLDGTRSTHSVLPEAQTLVSKKYEIHHSTIQVERFHNQMENCSMCEEPKD